MVSPRPLAAVFAIDVEVGALFSPSAEVAAMVRFEIALAEAQAEAGLMGAEAAAAVRSALAAFDPDLAAIAAGLASDGVAVPELVRQLRRAVGEPFAASVHQGATSQDATDTGLMLRLSDVLAVLATGGDGLVARISALGTAQGATPLMAHTRMQAALPFTVADKLATWTRPLQAHAARLRELRASRLAVQLGGPIGTGHGSGASAARVSAALARRLGLCDAAPWHSDRSRILDVAHAIVLLTGTLAKIGQDVALMAQSEVGAIRLTGTGGSSAMAHKANPVGAEVLVALGRFNAGLMGTLQQAMIHENERSGAAWTLEWLLLPQIAEAAGAALATAVRLLDDAVFVASDASDRR